MKTLAIIIAMSLFGAAAATTRTVESTTPSVLPSPSTQSVRFESVDVRIDPRGKPLAAYQVEVKAASGNVKLVGIEGGDHAAFRDPPYYDPAALSRQRVVLAAFDTGSDLPGNEFRAARLHVQIAGNLPPQWEVTVQTAAASDGSVITAAAKIISSLSTSATPTEGAAP